MFMPISLISSVVLIYVYLFIGLRLFPRRVQILFLVLAFIPVVNIISTGALLMIIHQCYEEQERKLTEERLRRDFEDIWAPFNSKNPKLKLEVGKTYRTRAGEEVKITEFRAKWDHPYMGDNHRSYAENGMYNLRLPLRSMCDLVEEIKVEEE